MLAGLQSHLRLRYSSKITHVNFGKGHFLAAIELMVLCFSGPRDREENFLFFRVSDFKEDLNLLLKGFRG